MLIKPIVRERARERDSEIYIDSEVTSVFFLSTKTQARKLHFSRGVPFLIIDASWPAAEKRKSRRLNTR